MVCLSDWPMTRSKVDGLVCEREREGDDAARGELVCGERERAKVAEGVCVGVAHTPHTAIAGHGRRATF